MKIGIIAFGYIPGGTGGTETYFRNLIRGLQEYDKKNLYTLIVKKEHYNDAKDLINSTNWKVLGLRDVPSLVYRGVRRLKLASLDNNSLLSRKINALDFDVVHFPMQTVYPYGIKCKKLVTFMDMQEVHFPNFFTKEELQFRKNNYKKSVKEADIVISISNYTKNDIVKYYGKEYKEKTRVVYLSNSESNKKATIISGEENLKPYFYYPAATWPHKNHEKLLFAFADVVKKHPDYKLVLTGLKRQRSSRIDSIIDNLGLKNKVIVKGYLPYEDINSIFRNAFALVFPSLFEGFGLPILEAMSMGVPVVSSNSASLPEVAGNAALYFDPKNVKDIANKMIEIIEDSGLRELLIKKGFGQAKKFSLEKMTKQTIKAYNEACYE